MQSRGAGELLLQLRVRDDQHAELPFGERMQVLQLPIYGSRELLSFVNDQ